VATQRARQDAHQAETAWAGRGLDSAEARRRLAEFGPNELQLRTRPPYLRIARRATATVRGRMGHRLPWLAVGLLGAMIVRGPRLRLRGCAAGRRPAGVLRPCRGLHGRRGWDTDRDRHHPRLRAGSRRGAPSERVDRDGDRDDASVRTRSADSIPPTAPVPSPPESRTCSPSLCTSLRQLPCDRSSPQVESGARLMFRATRPGIVGSDHVNS
jgi:hypothetical protein